jgi:hypothetical protein
MSIPVWTLDELTSCRDQCYPEIDQATVNDRYQRCGGIARDVFWKEDEPPDDIRAAVEDSYLALLGFSTP